MFTDEMTLGEARNQLYDLIVDGQECPCCHQFAKIYRRKVNSSMARGLIMAFRTFGLDYGYLQDIRRKDKADNREESKLRYWDLLEEEPTRRPDGGRAGWWRVTQQGAQWVKGHSLIPKYALLYDGECLTLEGNEVSIQDALGQKFNYAALMRGE